MQNEMSSRVTITELLRPTGALIQFSEDSLEHFTPKSSINQDDADEDKELFTPAEIRDMLQDYVTRHKLSFEEDSKLIVLDEVLASVFKKSAGDTFPKKDLKDQ